MAHIGEDNEVILGKTVEMVATGSPWEAQRLGLGEVGVGNAELTGLVAELGFFLNLATCLSSAGCRVTHAPLPPSPLVPTPPVCPGPSACPAPSVCLVCPATQAATEIPQRCWILRDANSVAGAS